MYGLILALSAPGPARRRCSKEPGIPSAAPWGPCITWVSLVGGGISTTPPQPPAKSFASILKGQTNADPSSSTSPVAPLVHSPSTYKGEPTLKIPKAIVEVLSKPFHFTLIGKFSHGRPLMERSRHLFAKLGLKGAFSLNHLDQKHMLIRLHDEVDFNRIWLRELWFFDGFPMRSFCWSPEFRHDIESSSTLVWISFPDLPIFLINK